MAVFPNRDAPLRCMITITLDKHDIALNEKTVSKPAGQVIDDTRNG